MNECEALAENDFAFSPLRVLVISDDAETLRIIENTLARTMNTWAFAYDLETGEIQARTQLPDVIFINVAMKDAAGLGVMHHLATTGHQPATFALVSEQTLSLGPKATALGALGILLTPPTGDEILSLLTHVQTRRVEKQGHLALRREEALLDLFRKISELVPHLATASSRRSAAERLSHLVLEPYCTTALLYLPAGEETRQLALTASLSPPPAAPAHSQELQILAFAEANKLEVVRLKLDRKTAALVLIAPAKTQDGALLLETLSATSGPLAVALEHASAREQSARGAMKDPASNAYTFSYFVDIAAREIDKARRHERRFALLTLGIESPETLASPAPEIMLEVAETIRSSVRETDVLARFDETEFYLLMPETGGPGAHTCRQRILAQLLGAHGLRTLGNQDFTVNLGVSTFPQDGINLSQLLGVARHRALAARKSPVRRLSLDRLSLPEILDALLWAINDAGQGLGPQAPRVLELQVMEALGLVASAVQEATRAGDTRILASQRSGVSIGSAVRAALLGVRDPLEVKVVDLSQHANHQDLEVLVLIAEHGTYAFLGRTQSGQIRAVHSSDPVLADLLVRRLGEIVGRRLLE